ncbi:dipeptide ABC transporter ATP-binding protein [Brevibacterium spongiae]|uniref:ABC transporter ATP-binding protein n=1 Tax=Brevibacterium spongiae TaxID=2909672 RepID=A0ABY5SNK9_9MICO|nr:ABC transporter ATP-binding protein [Brevibacterium spongiae]UVI35744.1 ABC transporter ATP-binding protein [Brevibacterium spongiae]
MIHTDLLAWPSAGAGTELLDDASTQTHEPATADPISPETSADKTKVPVTEAALGSSSTSTESPSTATPTPSLQAAPVLEVAGLSVTYPGAIAPAITDIDFSLAPGDTLAIVGESGSGKSTTAAALTGLLPAGTRVDADTQSHLGEDLTSAKPRTWQRILGTGIAYVPQDAGAGLNPVRTVSSALHETLMVNGYAKPQIRARIAEVLDAVGLDPQTHGRRYPHELSGGQRQRVLIANAIAARPALIIADEPTSALDATVAKQVLDVLSGLVAGSQTALVLITHDLGVAKERAAKLLVMQAGHIVETGPTDRVLADPQHAYTRSLLAVAPHLGWGRLRPSIDAVVPSHRPPTSVANTGVNPAGATMTDTVHTGTEAVLSGRAIVRDFGGDRPAVDGLDITLRAGTTVGIVGESGSGKTTSARILLGAERTDSGEITLHGKPVTDYGRKDLGRRIRYVHQDSSAALDPHYTVERILTEPLRGHRIGTRSDRPARVRELLDSVALDHSLLGRTPRELSGGQRQRLAIARALAVDPEVIILDEPVSALDVGVQAQILQLLVDLQARLGVAYLFISHDLAVIEQIADEVIVMKDGRVVESGPTARVLHESADAYTRALINAVPCFDDSAVRTTAPGSPDTDSAVRTTPTDSGDDSLAPNPTEPTGAHHA